MAIRFLDADSAEEYQVLTYEDLARSSEALASGLVSAGVRPGDRVAFFLPNSPTLVVSYYGTWLAGAVGVPCNPMHTAGDLEYQLRDSGARLLITTESLSRTAAEAARRLALPIVVAPARAPSDGDPQPDATSWTALLDGSERFTPADVVPERDLALLLYKRSAARCSRCSPASTSKTSTRWRSASRSERISRTSQLDRAQPA